MWARKAGVLRRGVASVNISAKVEASGEWFSILSVRYESPGDLVNYGSPQRGPGGTPEILYF